MKLPGLITPVSIRVHEQYEEPSDEDLRRNPNSLKVIMGPDPVAFPICEYLNFVHTKLAIDIVRYILVFDGPEKFYALIPMTSISTDQRLYPRGEKCKAYELIDWISQRDFDSLARLDGFVAREDAASMEWSKKRCFDEMTSRNLKALPVVRDSQLKGIVETSQLATSILVEILERLED